MLLAAPAGAAPAWLAPVNLSEAVQNKDNPHVAIDSQGDAVAVWELSNGINQVVQAAVRPVGGAWQTPVNLSQEEGHGLEKLEPQVAMDPQGNAVAAWDRFSSSNYLVEAAGYEAAGPFLNGLSIPSAGIAGQPLAFSVSPLDVWSALGETKWSFGDGAAATGTSVTHTYAAAGTFPVTLTSADALGNASSASATVTIAPATRTVPAKSVACVVPKLKGKTLKTATKALTKAECKLGKVKGKKGKNAKVKKQSPKSGTVLSPGAKVSVKLG